MLHYTIDVLGISGDGTLTPVECGDLTKEKARHLAWSFSDAYHWPYGKALPHPMCDCEKESEARVIVVDYEEVKPSVPYIPENAMSHELAVAAYYWEQRMSMMAGMGLNGKEEENGKR